VVSFGLVGRDPELAVLHGMLHATASGTGGAAVLTGAPGIGKTRLLVDVQEYAERLGLAVAPGRAIELDRAAPLQSLLSALRSAEPRIDLSRLREHSGDRLWYVDRLGDTLEEYLTQRGMLVLVDDAHWCDELSALALRVLVPRLASSPLRWLLARRPVPATSPGQDAVGWLVAEGAAEIQLGPLDDDAVKALCGNVIGAKPDATVLALAAGGRGNPFLLEQYLTALKTTDQILVSDGVASVVGGDLPSSFLSAVDQRLRGLSLQARRLLEAGAIFGRPCTVHAAARLLGVPATTLVPAADEAMAAGVLLEQVDGLTFAHDLLRQAVYDNLSATARATMHREAAIVVREEGRPPVEMAEHLVRAGRFGDREAVRVVRDAADEVATRAPSTAADLVLRALDMVPVDDPERSALSAHAVGLLASAGRVAQARELGEATLRLDLDVRTRATVLWGLAEALKHAGQNRLAAEYARRALTEPAVPTELQAHLHAIEAHALLYAGDMLGADRAGAEADRLGTRTAQPAAVSFGNAARSVVARAAGCLDTALGYAQAAVGIADRAGGAVLHRHPRIWLGSVLQSLDRFDEAEDVYTLGRQTAEELGSGWSQPLWHYYNASLLIAAGRLDEAVADAEAGIRVAEQLTALGLCVPLYGMLARIAVVRGQQPTAHEYLRRMNRLRADGITAAPEDVAWSIAAVQEADRQPSAAVQTLADLYRWLPDRLLLYSYDSGAAVELVQIALAAGDPIRARAAADAASRFAERNPDVASIAGVAAHAQGLVNRDPAQLRNAVALLRESPRPLTRAAALEDAATAEKDNGRRDRAVELLERAIADCTGCGARRAVDRMHKQLKTLGVQAGTPHEQARPPASPLSGLTAAELGIARLVADGLTNQQIAARIRRSPHTVDSHLRNIFGKLGINSRVALTRIILSGGLPE
jgi:DNA-binding CsgD family transcriptional regulator/tetratricopeptide (TPR) repeat protein